MFKRIHLSKEPTKTSTAVTETILLTVIGILLGYWFSSDKPFYSLSGFSWLVIGPFLSGLRYGFVYAFNSALVIIWFMWLGSEYYPPWQDKSFSSTALGLLSLAIVGGEFCNYWQREITRLKASSEYLDQRLAEVSNAFNLIKISHDQLEQRIASHSSLRESLLAVRAHIMKAKLTDSDMVGLSTLILRNFADYISIQQAGFYALNDSGGIDHTAIAFFGGKFNVNVHDALLSQVIHTQKTTSLKPDLVTQEEYSQVLLLAIPLVDVFGQLWGIVLVNKMPFRAFRTDNVRLAAILAGHIADLISMRFDAQPMKNIELQSFMVQVRRCMIDVNTYSVSGSLIAMQLTHKDYSAEITTLIMSKQRGLDSIWLTHNVRADPVVFLLLPLTDFIGVEGYKLRLEQMVKENYELANLEEAGIRLYRRDLAGMENLDDLIIDLFHELSIDESMLSR